jgi:hypothetical protein
MILVRKHAILISMSPISAIVTAEKLFVSVPEESESLMYMVNDFMQEKSRRGTNLSENMRDSAKERPGTDSFECRAYDALFSIISANHEREYELARREVTKALKTFMSLHVVTDVLRDELRILKNKIDTYFLKATGFEMLIAKLLKDPEALALMNISILKENPDLYKKPLVPEILDTHAEIENLLEYYNRDFKSMKSKLGFLRLQIQNTNRLVGAGR